MDRLKSLVIFVVLALLVGGGLFKTFKNRSSKSKNVTQTETKSVEPKEMKSSGGFRVPSFSEIMQKYDSVKCKTDEEIKLCDRFKTYKGNDQFGVVMRGDMILIIAPEMNDFRSVLTDFFKLSDDQFAKLSFEERKQLVPFALGTFVAWWTFNRLNPLGLKKNEYHDKFLVIAILGVHPIRGPGLLVKASAPIEKVVKFLPRLYTDGTIEDFTTLLPTDPGGIGEVFTLD